VFYKTDSEAFSKLIQMFSGSSTLSELIFPKEDDEDRKPNDITTSEKVEQANDK